MIDSSPSSAESSFRELDEVFLQTQTRIWLGELLSMRLDEELPLSDLLQDGELLFEVSKVVWDSLLAKCMELRHLKHKYGPFRPKKSSGKYRPYSNVDSFLKICKILGLSGIDLFSPSDVVEKRDIRKVCICIRALSKKARSKQLSVPDFDMVMYSVTMPTDMVGVIRRSLESPQCTFSSSSSYSSHKGSQAKLKQKNLFAPSSKDDDSTSSEESDEAESRYMGENSFLSASKFDYADEVESDIKCQCTEDLKDGQCKSASCYRISKKKSYHGISHVNSEERYDCQNGNVDVSVINFAIENDDSFMGDSSCMDVGENNYISDYLAFSDLMVHATDASNSVVPDGENNIFDYFLNVDSQQDTLDTHNGSQRVYSDDEDMEVSSTTSMSSLLGRLLNLELDNHSDEDDSSSTNIHSSVSKEIHYKDLFKQSEPRKEDKFDIQSHTVLIDSREAQSKMVPSLLSSSEYFLPSQEQLETSTMESPKGGTCDNQPSNPGNDFCPENRDDVVVADDQERHPSYEEKDKDTVGTTSYQDAPSVVSDDTNIHSSIVRSNPCETLAEKLPCLPVNDTDIAQEDTHVTGIIQHSISSAEENYSQDEREHSQGRKDTTPQQPPRKHNQRPLLKTVVKGTVIAGVLFLLLHISKNKGNNAQERRQNGRDLKHNGPTSSSTRQQPRRTRNGMYPAEKIKLGN